MPGQDTSSADEILKTVYEGDIREVIPTKVKTLQLFTERDAKQWGGRWVEYPLKVGRNQGSGAYTELGALASAGRQRYVDKRVTMRFLAGRIQVSAQAMKASEGSRNAFAPVMDQEMRGLVKDLSADMNRMMYQDGRGILALVNGTATSTTQTVDSPGGWAGSTGGNRFISPGMVVGCINPGTGDVRATTVANVSTIASAGTTITLDASKTWTDNDYVVRFSSTSATSVGDTSFNKEPAGLQLMVDDGTYVLTPDNVNRTSYPIYQSNVIGTVGALSVDVIQRLLDVCDERGDGEITDILAHHSVRRAYLAIHEADRRFMGTDLQDMDSGTRAAKQRTVSFGGIPWTVDKAAPYGELFAIDRSGFFNYQLVNGEWANESGAILKQIGTGSTLQDAFEAYYRVWRNFTCDYPSANGRLDGISATVSFAHYD